MASGEQAFIDDYIRKYSVGDERTYQTSVVCEVLKSAGLFSKDQKVELQPRTLVLGHYRFYLFPVGKDAGNAKKVVDVKYLDVASVDADQARFIVRSVNPISELGQVSLRTDRAAEILTAFVVEWRRAFGYLPMPVITGAHEDAPLPSEFATRRTWPFCAAYCGWSNYYDSYLSPSFLNFIEELELRGCTDLDLRDCPGIEYADTSGAILSLVPIFAALRFDCYFNSILVTGSQHKDLLSLVADVVRCNAWLTKVVVVETGSDQDGVLNLASAIMENRNYSLQMLDISQHPSFGDRGLQALSLALSSYGGRITHLRLANIGASGKGISSLFSAFRMNYRFSLGLLYLNLSGNKFDGNASTKLEDWIDRASSDCLLQSLLLGSTNVNLTNLTKLRYLPHLSTLDLSESKIDSSNDTKNLCSALEALAAITSVDLSGCGFAKADFAEAALVTVGARLNPTAPLALKLAQNAFGAYPLGDFQRFARALSGIQGLATVDISGIAPRDEQIMISLLDALKFNTTLHTLQLDFVRLKPKTFEFLNSLWQFPTLRNLSLSSSFSPEVIVSLLRSSPAPSERRLTELDISQNYIGDFGADAIVSYLKADSRLQSLKCDGNLFSVSGWSAIVTALRLSGGLTRVSHPILDLTVHKSFKSNGDDKNTLSQEYLAKRLLALTYEMQLLALKSTARELPNSSICFGERVHAAQLPTPTSLASTVAVPERLLSDTASLANSKDEDLINLISNTKLTASPSLHRPSSVAKYDPSVLLSAASQVGINLPPPMSTPLDTNRRQSAILQRPPSLPSLPNQAPSSTPPPTNFAPPAPTTAASMLRPVSVPPPPPPPEEPEYSESGYSGYEAYGEHESYSGYDGASEYTNQDTREQEKSRPTIAATSAAAIRQEKLQAAVESNAIFGTMTFSGAGGSPFDTFRLPVDPAELAAMEASIPPPNPSSRPSLATPPMPRLTPIHKPPPGPPKLSGHSPVSQSQPKAPTPMFKMPPGPPFSPSQPTVPASQPNPPKPKSPPVSPRSYTPELVGRPPTVAPASHTPPAYNNSPVSRPQSLFTAATPPPRPSAGVAKVVIPPVSPSMANHARSQSENHAGNQMMRSPSFDNAQSPNLRPAPGPQVQPAAHAGAVAQQNVRQQFMRSASVGAHMPHVTAASPPAGARPTPPKMPAKPPPAPM